MQMCWLSSLTHDFPNIRIEIEIDRKGSRKNKKQNEFVISTHMAGTWMSEGITKGFSVWIDMTVAKSQTHAVYTIRFF